LTDDVLIQHTNAKSGAFLSRLNQPGCETAIIGKRLRSGLKRTDQEVGVYLSAMTEAINSETGRSEEVRSKGSDGSHLKEGITIKVIHVQDDVFVRTIQVSKNDELSQTNLYDSTISYHGGLY